MSERLIEELQKLAGREQKLSPGGILFRLGDPILSLFLVTAGEVHLTRSLPHGSTLILQRARSGAWLAEASLFAERYHCDAFAVEEAVVRAAPMRTVRRAFETDPGLAVSLSRHLAHEVQKMRSRAEMLSLKSVAARLDAWLALNGGVLPPKGQWRHLAAEMGVAPEALYRELARRR